MAVRSLIVLLRQLRPRLLHRKDRGREQTEKTVGMANKAQEFGELKAGFLEYLQITLLILVF